MTHWFDMGQAYLRLGPDSRLDDLRAEEALDRADDMAPAGERAPIDERGVFAAPNGGDAPAACIGPAGSAAVPVVPPASRWEGSE